MKQVEKESLIWYGLHIIAKDNPELKYRITTQKELISNLYPLVYFGVIQYTLYRGISIDEIPLVETNEYVEYIIENLDVLYKVKNRFVKEKTKKINIKDPEIEELAIDIISGLLIPFINKYAFKKLEKVFALNSAYIRESLINYEYDINHESDDGKVKTSVLYPFLFTLNLVKVFDKNGLYDRVLRNYQKDKLIKKYESGREWREKEVEYLQESLELLKNDEEWSMFLSNFSISKWENFDIEERFKALFQLTKITTILMKDEITAVTMLSDGSEVYDMLKDYLTIYIDYDRYVDDKGNLLNNEEDTEIKILSPFSQRNVNLDILLAYIESKGDLHVKCDPKKLELVTNIYLKVFSKVRTLLLTHEYLPQVVDFQIAIQKKVYCDLLNIFEEVKENKFRRKIDFENFAEELFFIGSDEIEEVLKCDLNTVEEFKSKKFFKTMGKIMSFGLALKNYTARSMEYCLKELFKYCVVVFGPHPIATTIQVADDIEHLYTKFEKFIRLYDEIKNSVNDKKEYEDMQEYLELPSKLLN
ncbi:hypothetical protein SHELI_v1c02880 [Spiroplasma helicoides]|uniref:Uncharacterized protein n=1 Tax=Spiroplasma helicoides TaxID=216938 RepID=A0A1B3SJY0_9MOLU|nr:hypothetical protein [Spiroplasma helicoides]AOG60243.1 hypothetical protein SHELI_v1c02880 [Spiroplasma helicoides]